MKVLQKVWRGNGRFLLVFAIYALLTIIMTWPAFGQLGTHIPGTIGDSFVHLWTFTWLKNNFFQLINLDAFYTTQIYYPVGVSLLNHNLAWVNFAIWLPLQALFGPEAGYTLAFLLIFPFNGVAVYLFLRELGLRETAAFVGGLITAFWPYNLSHQGHPNLLLIAWVSFTLIHLHRLSKEPHWKNGVWLGIFLALIGITRWQLLIMAAPIIGIYTLWLLFQNWRGTGIRPLITNLTVAGILAIFLMLPFITPLLLYQSSRDDISEVIIDEFQYPADLLSYFVPGGYHPLWGENIQARTQDFVGNFIYVRSVGYIALALLLIGAVKRWQQAKIWVVILLVYWLLALGADLYIAGEPTIPLPFRLIQDSFLIKTLRFPDRFNVMLALPFSFLAAFGLETVLNRPRLRAHSLKVVGLLCLLILFEYVNEYQMHSVAIPAWYQTVAADEEVYAILDIPAFTSERFNSQYMRYQLFHGKPLVEGNIARTPPDTLGFIQQVPLLNHIRENRPAPDNLVNPSFQLRQLANENVRYVVLHKQHLSPNQLQSWRDWFVEPPWHEDEDVVVYNVDSVAVGQTVPLENVLIGSEAQPGLGIISFELVGAASQGGWLQMNLIWGNVNAALPANEDIAVCFTLTITASNYSEENCRPVSTEWPTSLWQEDEIVRAQYQIQVDPFAVPGNYELSLFLQDSKGEMIGQTAVLDSLQIAPLPRQFEQQQPETELSAQWQDLLALTGYDLQESPEQLTITLHWQALQQLDSSYKFFVHLIDLNSGKLVAQIDYIPRDWTYPTNWWAVGEYVVDTAVLPLESVGSGTYQLLVGIYDPDSGERLLTPAPESNNLVDALFLTQIDK